MCPCYPPADKRRIRLGSGAIQKAVYEGSNATKKYSGFDLHVSPFYYCLLYVLAIENESVC